METKTLTLEMPAVLPHGWKTQVANTLGLHRNTVKEALRRGGDDPTYLRIMKTAKEKYGNPINQK